MVNSIVCFRSYAFKTRAAIKRIISYRGYTGRYSNTCKTRTVFKHAVTELGMLTELRLMQPEKALSHIVVTLLGIVIFSNVDLLTTIFELIVFEPSDIVRFLILQPKNAS